MRGDGRRLKVRFVLHGTMTSHKMHLVVAVFNEPVDWIARWGSAAFVYVKNPNRVKEVQERLPDATVQELPNIGRESHTFLHHIVKHFHNLPSQLVFAQGNPWDHVDAQRFEEAVAQAAEFEPLGKLFLCRDDGCPHHCGLPLKQLFDEMFGVCQFQFKFVVGAQFVVSRARIHRFSLETFQALLDLHATQPSLPWMLERCWLEMFA